MSPKDFCCHPYDSKLRCHASETVACNIMHILSKTGNIWRTLSWEEYKTERLKDGNFSEREKQYFDNVIKFCKSEDTAILFSSSWYPA